MSTWISKRITEVRLCHANISFVPPIHIVLQQYLCFFNVSIHLPAARWAGRRNRRWSCLEPFVLCGEQLPRPYKDANGINRLLESEAK